MVEAIHRRHNQVIRQEGSEEFTGCPYQVGANTEVVGHLEYVISEAVLIL